MQVWEKITQFKKKKLPEKIWQSRKNSVPLHPHSTKKSVLSSKKDRDLAQLVAHTSGGREVAGSSPVIPTEAKELKTNRLQLLFLFP